MDLPATPFIPWTEDQVRQRIDALPALGLADLMDLAECLSEGIEDIPEAMQAYYYAVRAELDGRQRIA